MRSSIYTLLIFTLLIFACGDTRSKTKSGHSYTHHIKNNKTLPEKGALVEYHIVQRDERVLFSSRDNGAPKKFRIPEIDFDKDQFNRITPITEALMLMSEGDSLTLEINPDSLPAMIENSGNMFIDLKMISIKNKSEIAQNENAIKAKGLELSGALKKRTSAFKNGVLKGLESTEGGLKYLMHKKGKGEQIEKGNIILIHYIGQVQKDGKQFFNTFSNINPYQIHVGLNKIIPGWEQILPQLHVGDKLTLFVPSELAYGAAGSKGLGVPEKADLAFYMEIVRIKK